MKQNNSIADTKWVRRAGVKRIDRDSLCWAFRRWIGFHLTTSGAAALMMMTSTTAATFDGSRIDAAWHYPQVDTVYRPAETATVGPGKEFVGWPNSRGVDIDLASDSIRIVFAGNDYFGGQATGDPTVGFNGLRLTDRDRNLPAFLSVSLVETTVPGFTKDRIRVAPDSIEIDFAGIRYSASQVITLTVNFSTGAPSQPLPTRVDLTRYQTPVRYQGGRDTCGTFTATAALEAAYKREFDLELDLSEQYLNHWAQVMSFDPITPVPLSEVNAGAIGGGGIGRPLLALRKNMGLPTEKALPYLDFSAYQNADVGDEPPVTDWWKPHQQQLMDNFNLADQPATYVFAPPTTTKTTIMPIAALEGARYRPTGVSYFTESELRNIDTYRKVLGNQKEVMIELRCCDGQPGFYSTTPWVLPAGSNGGSAGHALLIVGYDDSTRMFRVKNSWGTNWADGGYAWVSYDLVAKAVYTAAYIHGVVPPSSTFDVWNNRQLWLGRWNLNFDGWPAQLDIYNIPDPLTNSAGNANYRLGTLFMSGDRVYRVNGSINGNRIDFWLEWRKPDLEGNRKSDPRQHAIFTAYVYSLDHRAMAGSGIDAWGPWPITAQKGRTLTGVQGSSKLEPSMYLGTWSMNNDGRPGTLTITSVYRIGGGSVLFGQYRNGDGRSYSVYGTIGADPRRVTFSINFPTPQTFSGRANAHQSGVMSGTTTSSGMTFGFHATRLAK